MAKCCLWGISAWLISSLHLLVQPLLPGTWWSKFIKHKTTGNRCIPELLQLAMELPGYSLGHPQIRPIGNFIVFIPLWLLSDRDDTGIQQVGHERESGKLVSVPISVPHLLYIHEQLIKTELFPL